MNRISAVLFDFDGVLIDSLPVMKKAWKSVQKKYSVKANFEQFKIHIGIPFESILTKMKINTKYHKSIKEHYSLISTENVNLIKLNPFVRFILIWLKENSISMGIVTSKDQFRTNHLIDLFQLDVKLVITPELTKRGKPFPDPILLAAKDLSVETKNIVFIGDMLSDMQCAFKAKCYYLHYLNGYQEIYNQSYGGSINSLKEIVEYINHF
ncbi:HAD family hydrolase [Prochlorococcus marinus]|uniref:HAD family hydrolase n=1 Tax=Prochlorococcus marinus TaxID=1219 RepID=UPI0022B558AB|nr:HAD-IA family hydrolase [Prochlorococcus marinus]